MTVAGSVGLLDLDLILTYK